MKTKRPFVLLGAIALSLFPISSASAEVGLKLPDASQAALVSQRIGLTEITISYHRPMVNGRKIWGGLVPLGEVWRAGANENTVVEFSDDVTVEGQPLPKGT